MKFYFFICLFLMACVSCGKMKSNDKKPEKSIEQLRESDLTQKETVKFHRKEQMISRYDCNGHITSRKLETLNSLSKKITINYTNRENAWEYKVYNRRTKNSNRGFGMKNGNFVVDYAPTVFNMRVKSGINDVEYTFLKCPKIEMNPQGVKICTAQLEIEAQGIIQVDVYYSSEVIPGEQHLHPSPESCKKP